MSDSQNSYQIPEEKLNSVYDRLDQWASKQGLFFQLRHGVTGRGTKGSRWIVSVLLRSILFALVAIGGYAFYLNKKVKSAKFWELHKERLVKKIGAEKASLNSVQIEKGRASIRNLAITGGEYSIIKKMECTSLGLKFSPLTVVTNNWDPGLIEINTLTLNLALNNARKKNPAGDTSFLEQLKTSKIRAISIADASIKWGADESNFGQIKGSKLQMDPQPDGKWHCVFQGGFFSQAWLKDIEIEEIELYVSKDDFDIKSASFKTSKETRAVLSGKMAEGDSSGLIKGTFRFRHLDIDHIRHDQVHQLSEGTISGEGDFQANLFEGKGISTQLKMELLKGDSISLIGDNSVLQALSIVDGSRNYRSIKLKGGKFNLTTSPRFAELKDIDLNDPELIGLKGEMSVTVKDVDEVKGDLKKQEAIEKATNSQSQGSSRKDSTTELERTGLDLSLKDLVSKGGDDKTESKKDESLGISANAGSEDKKVAQEIIDQALTPIFKGNLSLILEEDIFKNSAMLQPLYPASNGKVVLPFEFEGKLNEAGDSMAKTLIEKGTRK